MEYKKLLLPILFGCLYLSNVAQANAALVSINDNSKVILNVLSAEGVIELQIPQKESLKVSKVVDKSVSPQSSVSLLKDGDKIKLNVSTDSGDKSLDVTSYEDALIEIEERPFVDKLSIKTLDGKFLIHQRGISAITDYEIQVNPNNAKLTLSTPSGFQYLSVLPREAVDTLFRLKLIDRVVDQDNTVLKEDIGEKLSYEIKGTKIINLFNVYSYELPVTVKVSAITGEVSKIVDPEWMKYLGFLFL